MTLIDKKRIECWTVLVLSDPHLLKDVPEKYKDLVEVEVAKRILGIIGSGD